MVRSGQGHRVCERVLGMADDLFLHAEFLRAAGIACLETGEAVALTTVKGDRGWMTAEVADWAQCYN